jgi:hypothetical protein
MASTSFRVLHLGQIGLLVALSVTGCGDDGEPPPLPPDDAPPAVAVDGAVDSSTLFSEDLEVGEVATAQLTLINRGGKASSALEAALSGPQASAFFLDAAASTCLGAELAPAATCVVALRFSPDREGALAATLQVGATLSIPLRGTARPRRPRLTVTFAGAGRGAVQVSRSGSVEPPLKVCRASCQVVIEPGVALHLKADTPSQWAGFSGACSAAERECTFTPTAGAAVSARFDADPRERITLLFPDEPVLSVDYAGAGELVVGTSRGVVKVARDGREIWRRSYPGEARVGAGDAVFVRGAATLTKLDAAGAPQWTVPAVAGGCGSRNFMARGWSAMPDGGVAIQGPTSIAVYNGDGSARFTTAPIGSGCRGALTVDSTNQIYTGVSNENGESSDLRVFSAAGAELPSLERVSGQYHLALASSFAGGQVAWSSSGHGYVDVGSLTQYFTLVDTFDADYRDNGVAIAGDGDLSLMFAQSEEDSQASGVVLRRFAATRQLRWELVKTVLSDPIALETTGVTPADLDLDERSRDLAVGGRYVSPSFDGGWVEIFAEP